jgi:IS30 family transposase
MASKRRRRAPYRWLTPPQRRAIERRLEEGARIKDVVAEFGSSEATVWRIRDRAQLSRRRVDHSELRLRFDERERISRGLVGDESARAIARDLGRAPSTITREIERCGGRRRYRALSAERRALEALSRPKQGKLSRCLRLRRAVETGLERRLSPQQISARLKIDHRDDQEMRISHETIYQSLFVQSRGELRRQLAANLRSGRTKRKPRRGAPELRGRIPDQVSISERPPEIADRAVPGHWEGDLLVGARGRSFVATLVERKTRFVILARLGSDRSSRHVTEALAERIRWLPEHLALSLTWDQGNELSLHRSFSRETGIDVYFCDPHSPWQRGSNENTNGLLRQYMPKGSDLSVPSQAQLDEIAAELNGRPRQTLGWATPAEKMAELLR